MAVISFVIPRSNDGLLTGATQSISQTRQTMPEDGVMDVGLSGDSANSVSAKVVTSITASDPLVVSITELGTTSSGVRWLRLSRRRAGTIKIVASDAKAAVLASFDLVIKSFSGRMPEIELPKASGPMDFEIEPGDPAHPGAINMRVSTPADNVNYVDRRMDGIGYHIWLFGFVIVCDDIKQPIYVSDHLVDLSVTKAEAIDNVVYDSIEKATAAIRKVPARGSTATRFAYYRGAGGMIVPTVFSPATTPRVIATYFEARRLYAEYVQQALTVIAISIVGGTVLRVVLGRILRAFTKDPPPPPRGPLPKTTAPPAVERLRTTADDMQNKNPVRTVEVLTEPRTYRHSLTAHPQPMSYAQIEKQGSMNFATGANAQYGAGVYAWPANKTGVGAYIDIQVKPGTGVETLDVAGTKFVRLMPPTGDTLPVKITGTNVPKADIKAARKFIKADKGDD